MVEILHYKKENTCSTYSTLQGGCASFEKEGGLLWVDIEGFNEAEIAQLEKAFNFHPLAIEDCISTSQRPKIDKYDDYLFTILHAAHLKPKKFGIETIELNSFVGKNYIVTVHGVSIPSINSIKARCKKNPALMSKGSSELFYLIVDAMIDNYFPILDKLDNEIDKVEKGIFENPGEKLLDKLFSLKNDTLALRRIIGPQREAINLIARGEYPMIGEGLGLYFRDVSDQLARIVDILETYRDILSSTMDGYMSTISNKTNEVMKILTIIMTMMMPLTLITGVYGMNFKFMPELYSPYGYYTTLSLMLLIALGMLIFFKRKKWL